jgi:hypothetical protein
LLAKWGRYERLTEVREAAFAEWSAAGALVVAGRGAGAGRAADR